MYNFRKYPCTPNEVNEPRKTNKKINKLYSTMLKYIVHHACARVYTCRVVVDSPNNKKKMNLNIHYTVTTNL